METYIIKNVEALWPKINTTYHFDSKVNKSMPCGALDDGAEYSVQFRMDDATAKSLYMEMAKSYKANKKEKWAEKLERPFIKDDEGMFTHKANLKGAYSNNKTTKPLQVDAQGTKLPDDFLLTTGSTVNIAVTFNPYDFGGKQNVNLRLKAVQVVKYVPMEDRNPFDTVDGFTIDEEVSPFKILSREDLNKIDEEPKEETIEEPKKVISKKSAPPPTSNDDDLSAIIDDWD
jgi:hypothetical protein|tara:strand:+ start:58 stop:750 length:693 start_codon:yes stop_codon:yes gene_type:complete